MDCINSVWIYFWVVLKSGGNFLPTIFRLWYFWHYSGFYLRSLPVFPDQWREHRRHFSQIFSKSCIYYIFQYQIMYNTADLFDILVIFIHVYIHIFIDHHLVIFVDHFLLMVIENWSWFIKFTYFVFLMGF